MSELTASSAKREAEGARPFAYMELYRASPIDRVALITQGVPASKVKRLVTDLHVDQKMMFGALNLKTATINKKAARNELLSTDDGERVIGLAKLVGQLEAMIEESGDSDGFDAAGWLATWLREPLPALGGSRPMEFLGTMEGQSMVATALAQIQSGAFA